jgi:hypothetical protein
MVPSVISPRMNIRRNTVATRSAIFGSRRLVTSIATSTDDVKHEKQLTICQVKRLHGKNLELRTRQ